MQPLIKALITNLLDSKKEAISFEELGRSLSYCPYTPRLNASVLKSIKNANILNIKDSLKLLDFKLDNSNPSSQIIRQMLIFDCISELKSFTLSNNKSQEVALDLLQDLANMIDISASFRRLSPYFLAFYGVIFDKYQVLECYLGGIDCIIFDRRYIDNIDEILEFCNALGIFIALECKDLEDIRIAKQYNLAIFMQNSNLSFTKEEFFIISKQEDADIRI